MANDKKEEKGDKRERPQREPLRQLRGQRRGGPPPQSPLGGIWRQYKMPIMLGVAFLLILVLVLPSLSGPVGEEVTDTTGTTQDQVGDTTTTGDTQAGTRVTPGDRRHIQEGEKGTYSSNPPTSGVHYNRVAPWGCHDQSIADEVQVHNLEHGGIMVQYNPVLATPDMIDQLKEVVGQYENRVILAPYPNLSTNAIALTAWGWIDTLDTVDKSRVTRFINGHIRQGPEQTDESRSLVLPCS